jgi:hypothetical protein
MEIKYQLTRKDYTAFNKYYFLKKGLKRRKKIILIAIVAIIIIVNFDKPFDLLSLIISIMVTLLLFPPLFLGLSYISILLSGNLPSDKGSIYKFSWRTNLFTVQEKQDTGN